MIQRIKETILIATVLFIVFAICFVLVTALCDAICHMNGYYEQAAQEGYVQSD